MANIDLSAPHFPNWCPGCGNFGIWGAFKNAAEKLNFSSDNTVITAGIGCHGHIINFVKLPTFESLHGRAIPVACGIQMVNPTLHNFVFVGDGDCLGEGGNHFLHACRRNPNIVIVLHNNSIYGLTTGQTSPTTSENYHSKSTPSGNHDFPIHPSALAITAGATFVARAYAGDIASLTDILIRADKHPGIAIVEVLQPCVTFQSECTHAFFQKNTYQLPADFGNKSKAKAIEKALEWGESQIPLGVFYEEIRPAAESEFDFLTNRIVAATAPSVRDISAQLSNYY